MSKEYRIITIIEKSADEHSPNSERTQYIGAVLEPQQTKVIAEIVQVSNERNMLIRKLRAYCESKGYEIDATYDLSLGEERAEYYVRPDIMGKPILPGKKEII